MICCRTRKTLTDTLRFFNGSYTLVTPTWTETGVKILCTQGCNLCDMWPPGRDEMSPIPPFLCFPFKSYNDLHSFNRLQHVRLVISKLLVHKEQPFKFWYFVVYRRMDRWKLGQFCNFRRLEQGKLNDQFLLLSLNVKSLPAHCRNIVTLCSPPQSSEGFKRKSH